MRNDPFDPAAPASGRCECGELRRQHPVWSLWVYPDGRRDLLTSCEAEAYEAGGAARKAPPRFTAEAS